MSDRKFQSSKNLKREFTPDNIDNICLLESGNEELQLVILQSLYSNLHKADIFRNAIGETTNEIYREYYPNIAEEFWDLEVYCNRALLFYQNTQITQLDLLKKTLDFYIYELLEKNLHFLLTHKAKATIKWSSKYECKTLSNDELDFIVNQYTLDDTMADFCHQVHRLLNLKPSQGRA